MTNDIEELLWIILALQGVILFTIYVCYYRLFIRTVGQINRVLERIETRQLIYIDYGENNDNDNN